MIPAFRKINADDFKLMQVQSNVEKTLAPLSRLELVNGNLVEVIVGTSPIQVEHLLSREPLGWFIVGKNANSDVWQTQPFTLEYITLQATATATVTIWVF